MLQTGVCLKLLLCSTLVEPRTLYQKLHTLKCAVALYLTVETMGNGEKGGGGVRKDTSKVADADVAHKQREMEEKEALRVRLGDGWSDAQVWVRVVVVVGEAGL